MTYYPNPAKSPLNNPPTPQGGTDPVVYRDSFSTGVAAGVFAGLVMLIFWMGYSWLSGAGFSHPLKLIAATFFGERALFGGAGVGLVGVLTHFTVAAGLGILFAALLRHRTSFALHLGLGLAFGFVVWALATYLFVPPVNPYLASRLESVGGWWFFFHLVFGACLAFTPLFRTEVAVPRSAPQRQDRAA